MAGGGRWREYDKKSGKMFGMVKASVAEAAVIGIPDVDWGEVVKAVCIPTKGASSPSDDDMTVFVKARLASYKAPSSYEWVDELPRNHLGKVLKTDLRETYSN